MPAREAGWVPGHGSTVLLPVPEAQAWLMLAGRALLVVGAGRHRKP